MNRAAGALHPILLTYTPAHLSHPLKTMMTLGAAEDSNLCGVTMPLGYSRGATTEGVPSKAGLRCRRRGVRMNMVTPRYAVGKVFGANKPQTMSHLCSPACYIGAGGISRTPISSPGESKFSVLGSFSSTISFPPPSVEGEPSILALPVFSTTSGKSPATGPSSWNERGRDACLLEGARTRSNSL